VSAASKKGGQRLWALFTTAPQLSDADRAAHYIEHHFEQRERHALGSHGWHIERIKLDWWVKELLRINAASRGASQ
jgi:hypothetical protein